MGEFKQALEAVTKSIEEVDLKYKITEGAE
jgi:hypothetical protein